MYVIYYVSEMINVQAPGILGEFEDIFCGYLLFFEILNPSRNFTVVYDVVHCSQKSLSSNVYPPPARGACHEAVNTSG